MFDVAIVGAGPVGTLLACELAVRGIHVTLLERRVEPSMHSRAIGIHPPSLAVLERLGIADELLPQAVRITGGEARCDGRLLASLSFDNADARYPFVASVPQYETESLLRARLEELRPGTLTPGVTVTTINQRLDGVEVLTEANDDPIRARFVVAADGARSLLRNQLGTNWSPIGAERSYLMADFVDDPHRAQDATSAVLYFERGGVVESFPLPGGRRRWVAMTDQLWPEADTTDLAGLVRFRTGVELSAAKSKTSAFVARQHRTQRMRQGRVFLIGDAAHELSPIGGQGMNLGWLDAAALAAVLGAVVSSTRESNRLGAPESAALAKWERARQTSARRAMRQAAFNMSMGVPRRNLPLRARNALIRTLSLPPARGHFTGAFTMRGL